MPLRVRSNTGLGVWFRSEKMQDWCVAQRQSGLFIRGGRWFDTTRTNHNPGAGAL